MKITDTRTKRKEYLRRLPHAVKTHVDKNGKLVGSRFYVYCKKCNTKMVGNYVKVKDGLCAKCRAQIRNKSDNHTICPKCGASMKKWYGGVERSLCGVCRQGKGGGRKPPKKIKELKDLKHVVLLRSVLKKRIEQLLAKDNKQQCSKCGEIKPFKQFVKAKNRKNGTERRCSECHNKRQWVRRQSINEILNNRMTTAINNHLKWMFKTKKANKNNRKWEEVVGYTLTDLMNQLELKFKDGMGWENYAKWHIDHIMPKSKFKFSSMEDEEFKKCWALDNLQPLWATDNIKKNNRIPS